jgi:mannose-1-phosphate guanylyltransferase
MPAVASVPLRTSLSEPIHTELSLDWTIALAGGDGSRIQDYITRRFGVPIPKQYCRVIDQRSVLEHTLDRLNLLTPASRTMTVIGADHRRWAIPQLVGRSDHVFCQPQWRDTAVAVYVTVAMIMRWHPNAIVTIAPTDHYIVPASRYLDAIVAARQATSKLRSTVVLIGVATTEPEPDVRHVVLGSTLSEEIGVHQVAAFVNDPTALGAVWRTAVVCGSVSALWELGRATEPRLLEILDSLIPLVGTEDEADAIDYIYRTRLPVSFSRDVYERATARVAALPIPGVEWSDLTNPDRVERVMELAALPGR